jgi:hypothetical protein
MQNASTCFGGLVGGLRRLGLGLPVAITKDSLVVNSTTTRRTTMQTPLFCRDIVDLHILQCQGAFKPCYPVEGITDIRVLLLRLLRCRFELLRLIRRPSYQVIVLKRASCQVHACDPLHRRQPPSRHPNWRSTTHYTFSSAFVLTSDVQKALTVT